MDDSPICAEVILGAPASSAYFFSHFPLVPPYEEFQKMADFGVFCKMAIARNGHNSDLRALLEERFPPELLVRMIGL